jgi:HK97 family phage portal protein
MFKGFAYYWLVNGNVYWFKVRDKADRVTALWLLDSEQTEPRWPDDGSEFISHYEIRVDGKLSRLEVRDVIHFRYGIDPRNHRKGLAPLRALVEEVIADESAISYSKAAMGSLGVPPFIVSPKPNADSVYTIDAEKVKEMLMSRTVGGERGKPIVFSAPMDIAQLGFNPGQMSLKEIHSLPEERVAAVLGIPAMVLGYGAGLEHSHYSNYESALKAAWNGFVIPTMKVIASELGHQLLPDYYNPAEKERWVEFDTSEVWALQEDEKSIAEREVIKWNAGLTTRNEARSALGLEPLPDGDTLNELPVPAVPIEQKQFNPSEPAQYEELRDWWEKFGPKEAREILDATELEK